MYSYPTVTPELQDLLVGTEIVAAGEDTPRTRTFTIGSILQLVETASVPDASVTQRGLVSTGTQSFGGAKTFVKDLIVSDLTIGEGGVVGGGGANNTAVGKDALKVNTSNNNTAIGKDSLLNNVGGVQNTAVGSESLLTNISGVYNTAIGYRSLMMNTANNNTAVGLEALLSNSTGFQNTAVGSQALTSNTLGEENTAFGKDALRSNLESNWNTAVGSSALQNNTEGYQNTAAGRFAMRLNISGNYNTAIGVDALTSNLSSNYNTALGYKAGVTTIGFQNTFVGAQESVAVGQIPSVINSIAIGFNAYTTKNNQAVLGNNLVTETVLRGTTLVNGGVFNAVDSLIVGGSTKSTQYKLTALNTAPASATATGTLGDIRVTNTHIYVCIATNVWVRAALTTWV